MGKYTTWSIWNEFSCKLNPAVRMLCDASPLKQKKQQASLAKKGGGFIVVAGGNWGRPGALQQHRQPPPTDSPSPDSTVPEISAFSNMTFTSSRSSAVRTLDRRTSWAPRRNSIYASAPSFKKPPLPSTPSFWEWVAPSIHTLEPFQELGPDSQRVKKFTSKLHVHSVNCAAKLVRTRRALSSTIINSHQVTVSGQACNPPDPHWSFFFLLVEDFYGARYQSCFFSLISVGSGFPCLCSFFFSLPCTQI